MSVRRFKPYPAYKDSGVEWLGEIPAHRESLSLSHVTQRDVMTSRYCAKHHLPILDQEQIGRLPLLLPPLKTQRPIATCLDGETARIDALIARIRDAVDRVKELRTALIAAAVTGKIDVRN